MPAPTPSSTVQHGTPATGALAWEVLPVGVPPGLDQPQWVVRSIDGSLIVLEQERWIGPLGEEIRAAISERLVQKLGVSAPGPTVPWQVRIDVQRFESAPGREARIDVIWTVGSVASTPAKAVRCHGEYAQLLETDGYMALAAGHQRSVAHLADAIGAALQALAAGQAASCAAA